MVPPSSADVKNYSIGNPFKFQELLGSGIQNNNYNPKYLNDITYNNFVTENNQKFNGYHRVYSFILDELIPKYDELFSCDIFYENIDDDPSIEYYIKFNEDLSFKERDDLHYSILEDINNFCIKSSISSVFKNIIILLVKK